MKNKIDLIRIETNRNNVVVVSFYSNNGIARRRYPRPSSDSLYRLLNNSMVLDICAYNEPYGLTLEITPKY